jgi:hypothetical protein
MNKRDVATFCYANFQRQYHYVLLKNIISCIHIISFTQFIQKTKNPKKTQPFLFLPNENLYPGFRKRIAFGDF